MKTNNSDMRNFLTGALGYSLGAIAGFVFIYLVARLGVARWLVGLIDDYQAFWQLLGLILIAGFLLALGGAVIGGIGGYSLRRIMNLEYRSQTIVGSAIAFAISTGLLTLVFLLLIGFIGLYNNFNTNRIEQFGILFGLFGLVFGLLTGILQALMSVRLRHSWRLILAVPLGFMLGGVLLGLVIRWLNPTEPFGIFRLLALLILVLGLLAPFFFGGGFLGFTHGRLARNAVEKDDPADYILPTKWQTYIVAAIGLILAFWLMGLLDSIAGFLTITPADLTSQLRSETVGVWWTPTEPYSGDIVLPATDQKEITINVEEVEHRAWCSSDGVLYYQVGDSGEEQILSPQCSGVPALAVDLQGQPHLVWYAQELVNATGVPRPTNVLVESIRTPYGWSEAAIAAHTEGPAIPNLSIDTNGNLILVWQDIDQNQYFAIQENYQCDEESLSYLEIAGLEAVISGDYRPEGVQIPYCRNEFKRIHYTPNPQPEYSDEPITPNGAFDQVAELADAAEYEVLFATMQYEPNKTPPSPGSVLANAVAELYQQVKTNPDAYPRGMTVRILLGNYPEMSDFAWGTQIIDAIMDLRAAGVEKMVDPEIGWRLEVANYSGTYPHSHTKFIVVDGKGVASAGYNYGYLHLPQDHPSGQGYDMLDLGMQINGPVAQDAISAFDDMWDGADQIHCEDFHPVDGSDWMDTCKEIKAVADHVPEVLRTFLPPEASSNAFSLYRTEKYKEGDTFIAAALSSAEESIDLMHVNFAMEVICMANLIFPNLCTIDNALPWMDAIIEAIEKNQVPVRVIAETTNSNGLENRIAGRILMDELERRGYGGLVEIRFYNGKLHAKSTLIDDRLLIIGSMNMHYSSWGDVGLTEHSLTTNDPDAIAEYKGLFETKWTEAIPFDEAKFGSSP